MTLKRIPCSECDGAGVLVLPLSTGDLELPCPLCRGRGGRRPAVDAAIDVAALVIVGAAIGIAAARLFP